MLTSEHPIIGFIKLHLIHPIRPVTSLFKINVKEVDEGLRAKISKVIYQSNKELQEMIDKETFEELLNSNELF